MLPGITSSAPTPPVLGAGCVMTKVAAGQRQSDVAPAAARSSSANHHRPTWRRRSRPPYQVQSKASTRSLRNQPLRDRRGLLDDRTLRWAGGSTPQRRSVAPVTDPNDVMVAQYRSALVRRRHRTGPRAAATAAPTPLTEATSAICAIGSSKYARPTPRLPPTIPRVVAANGKSLLGAAEPAREGGDQHRDLVS